MPRERILKTDISKAYWCAETPQGPGFAEAQIGFGPSTPGCSIAWFDQLFEGGIRLSQTSEPRLMLLSGPPGSGKTTLALELCYRAVKADRSWSALYLSLDADSTEVIANASKLGWENAPNFIEGLSEPGPKAGKVAVWGRSDVEKCDSLLDMVNRAFKMIPSVVDGKRPNILVIDSLNIVEEAHIEEYFESYLKDPHLAIDLIVFVLDSSGGEKSHHIWEYACDIMVRMDYVSVADYYLRTIEVVKARFQSHVWGKHQLKIYSAFSEPPIDAETAYKLRRAHPYRKEGGVFIFPSIHYYLSAYKRLRPTESPKFVPAVPEDLGKIVALPEGRCTAFVGSRGGHKSHLGYLNLLHRCLAGQEGALVISLRDDEAMTISTMQTILDEDMSLKKAAKEFLHNMRRNEEERITPDLLVALQKLEILYYHPGYITPEEFFHRMFISVQRLKASNRQKLTFLFNSLDQLSARFPLCAKQEIFVPGIVGTLCGEGITSIFVAVDEPGQPAEQYGLLPMADLILEFKEQQCSVMEYCTQRETVAKLSSRLQQRMQDMRQMDPASGYQYVEMRVVRDAGGRKAGSRGMLELVRPGDLDRAGKSMLYEETGLYFTPLSSRRVRILQERCPMALEGSDE